MTVDTRPVDLSTALPAGSIPRSPVKPLYLLSLRPVPGNAADRPGIDRRRGVAGIALPHRLGLSRAAGPAVGAAHATAPRPKLLDRLYRRELAKLVTRADFQEQLHGIQPIRVVHFAAQSSAAAPA